MATNNENLDWISETDESIDARLAGARHIQDQVRFVLGVMALISMMILIASYNAYLSFDYSWALDEAERKFPTEKSTPDILTEQALRSWSESRNVMISLVGIRVNVDDAPVLGTGSLFVASLWLVLLARRENRTIGRLLQDTDSTLSSEQDTNKVIHRREKRWFIFHSIVSNSVFINLDGSLARIRTLRGAPRAGADGRVSKVEEGVSGALTAFFFLFPPIACLLMFGLDRWSYFRASPFRPDAVAPGMGGFFWQSLVFFFICWIPLLACCVIARFYATATEGLLREYREALFAEVTVAGQQQGPK